MFRREREREFWITAIAEFERSKLTHDAFAQRREVPVESHIRAWCVLDANGRVREIMELPIATSGYRTS
jgi:hypothetical protein